MPIQIKRSSNTAIPPDLANGEPAFTTAGNVLFIGADGIVLPIAGARNPGILTANQAIVTNSSNFINNLNLSNRLLLSNSASNLSITISNSSSRIDTSASLDIFSNNYIKLHNHPNFDFPGNTAANSNWIIINDNGIFLQDHDGTGAVVAEINITPGGITAIGNLVPATSDTYSLGNSTFSWKSVTVGNVSLNTTGFAVGSSIIGNSSTLAIGTGVAVIANGSTGSQGQVLHSNGSSVYWDTDNDGVTAVSTGNGLTGGTITTTGTVSVLANTGIIANSTGLYVNSNYIGTLTANNSTNFGGLSLATVQNQIISNATSAYTNSIFYTDEKLNANVVTLQGQITSNATAAYTNAVAYVEDKFYANTQQLNANVVTLQGQITSNSLAAYTNAVAYVDNKFYANTQQLNANVVTLQGHITSNAATAYTNAVAYIDNKFYANTLQLSANVATLQGQITSNATTAYTNAVTYVDSKFYANTLQLSANVVTLQGQITSNAATTYSNAIAYVDSKFYANTSQLNANVATLQGQITSNAAAAYTNAVLYVDNKLYVNTSQLNANVVTLQGQITSNATTAYSNAIAYVEDKFYANTSQLSANVTTLQGQITSNAATAYSNAVAYVDSRPFVNTSQLSSNLANYQTTAGLAANVANLTANNSSNFGGLSLATVQGQITGNAATAYTNATVFSSNATNLITGTVAEPRLPFRMDQNVRTTDDVNFGSVTVSGNLTVSGSYTVVTGNSVVYTDNMIYLNQGISANITNIVSNGTHLVFTANNNYQVGWDVTVTGVNPSSYNGTYLNIAAANSTTFTVANTNTDAYVSGGMARGKSEANPDIGIAAGYNDGTYHHTGFFRDHATGIWKVYDSYLPEPDASVYIDQSNASFNIAPFQASYVRVGNNSNYGIVNTTNYTGTSNNALNLGGLAASLYVNTSQLSSNLTLYQTTAGLAANVATLTANDSTNFGGLSLATVQGQITGNAATAYTNAVAYVDGKSYVNTAQLSANVVLLQSQITSNAATAYTNAVAYVDGKSYVNTSQLSANVSTLQGQITSNAATAYTNAVAYVDGKSYVNTAQLSANVATLQGSITSNAATAYTNAVAYVDGKSYVNTAQLSANIATVQDQITSNAATAYTNAVAYVDGKSYVNTSQLSSNLTNYQTVAGLAANVATLTSNNSTNFGGLSLATVQGQITGNAATAYTNAVNYVTSQSFANTSQLSANVATLQGQITSNAATAYSNAVAYVDSKSFVNTSQLSTNLANYVTATNLTNNLALYATIANPTFTGNVTTGNVIINSTGGISANGGFGTNGQILTSNGSSVYWANASGGFTNGQSISVNNFVITGAFTANASNGTAGQVLTSNGSGVYWTSAAAGVNTAAQYVWTNTHNFTNVVTFSTANAIILPSGNTASRPAASNGMIRYNTNTGLIEVVASNTWTGLMSAYPSVREQFTASNNQTTFTVTGGYLPGQIDVYYNGVKLRNGSEVQVTSGNTFILAAGAANGALIEVVGIGPTFVVSNTAQLVYQQFIATNNQTTFTLSGGYVPGQVDVFADGIRLVNGVDVNASSGTNIVLTTGVPNNTIIEVKGYVTPLVSAQTSTAVRQTFTANSTVNNNFTVTGGYIPGQVDVFYNGAKLVNGTDVNTSSGTTIVLTSNAAANAIVDVVGINYFTAGGGVTTPVRQQFVASNNQTTFTVAGGYTPGQIDVFRNGVKLTPGTDVNISGGSTVVLASGAANGDNVDVIGFAATSYQDSIRKSGDTVTGGLFISGSLISDGSSYMTISTLTDSATITPNFAVRNNFAVTLTGNRTLANPVNLNPGQSGVIFITQDGTGSRTLAYGSFWDFPNITAPTLTTTANAVDVLVYTVRSSTSIAAQLLTNIG